MFRTLLPAALALAVLGMASPPVAAHEMGPGGAHVGDIIVEDAFVRAPARPGGAGAAYMTVRTLGEADRLIGAASDVAARVELHTHLLDDGGVARMRRVEAIAVEPDADAVLAPGGLHVMLMGVTRPLADGDVVALTLIFETTGEVAVSAPVRAIRGTGQGGGHGMGHGAGAMTGN